jgi:hypothetical protein
VSAVVVVFSEWRTTVRTTNYISVIRPGRFDGEYVFFDDTEELATSRAHAEATRIAARLTVKNPNTNEPIPPRVAVYRRPIFDDFTRNIPAIVDNAPPRFIASEREAA